MKQSLSILEQYKENPVIRGLIQLIPFGIGSGIDVALCVYLENIKQERAKAFFDELSNGSISLSPELLESEDFLHCYFSTVKGALNTRRREKIKMFARLLKSSIVPESFSSCDEFEEYLQILDELSYREISILIKLDKYELQYPMNDKENELQRANRFWNSLTREIAELGVPVNEIDSVLSRMNRTGCYETFVGGYLDYTGGKGKVTPTFRRLKEMII